MLTRTFKFTGSPDMKKEPYDQIMFFDPESRQQITLKKGASFTTGHPTLISELEEREDMEETQAAAKEEKGAKDSPRSDGKRA